MQHVINMLFARWTKGHISNYQEQIPLTFLSMVLQQPPDWWNIASTAPGSDRKEVCRASETSNSVGTIPTPWEKHPGISLVVFLDVEKYKIMSKDAMEFLGWDCWTFCIFELSQRFELSRDFTRIQSWNNCRVFCWVQSIVCFLHGIDIFLVPPLVHSVPSFLHRRILIL